MRDPVRQSEPNRPTMQLSCGTLGERQILREPGSIVWGSAIDYSTICQLQHLHHRYQRQRVGAWAWAYTRSNSSRYARARVGSSTITRFSSLSFSALEVKLYDPVI